MARAASPSVLWSKPAPVLEGGDCACPDDGLAFVPPAAPPATARWEMVPDVYRAELPGQYELISSPIGSSSVVVLNDSARQILDAVSAGAAVQDIADRMELPPQEVVQTVEQLALLNIVQPVGHGWRGIQSESHTLTAWLHLTNACNLNCKYCYLTRDGAEMDQATGLAAVEAVFRAAQQHGFKQVKLKYAGGEPSMNFALVRVLHEQALSLARQHGLELREVMLSNGISLTRPMLHYLRDAGIRLALSLDSVDGAGDLRVFHNGRSSSDLAARAVDRALACGVTPHLSITVSQDTASRLAAVVAFALDRGLTFNLNFVRDLGAEIHSTAEDQILAGLRDALAVIEDRLPRQSVLAALVDHARFDQPHAYACGAGRNYLVIDHRGRVARCQMQMSAVVSDIWQDDPLGAVRMTEPSWSNLPVDAKPDCATCPWRYWCAGGCALMSSQSGGRSGARSPYCAIYRAIYPEVLRVESLRLLKWEGVVA